MPDINPQCQVFSVNPQNSAPDFGSTYGSKSEDLNVLIHGLETLNNQVVTNNNPHLGQYKKVLTNIITPKSTDSSIVPENEELQTNSSFTKLSSLRNNQELQDKFSLISDVSRYINHIYGVLKGYQTEAESLKEGKSKSSHIEGMSSIISDMTYGKILMTLLMVMQMRKHLQLPILSVSYHHSMKWRDCNIKLNCS